MRINIVQVVRFQMNLGEREITCNGISVLTDFSHVLQLEANKMFIEIKKKRQIMHSYKFLRTRI